MKQIGTKPYCKNCAVHRAWMGDYKIYPKCACKASDNMRCKNPEMFEQKYSIETVRKYNHHK